MIDAIASWSLAVAGCGTAGLACVRALCRGRCAEALRGMTLIDRAVIRPQSAITCPSYSGHVGRPKVERLAALAAQWLGSRVPIVAHRADVHDVDWEALWKVPEVPQFAFVLIGLDCWPSRISVLEGLRHLGSATRAEILAIQVGVESREAQVSVFGNQWSDPCSACGLAVLPGSEPCVVFSSGGGLLRGNLQAEAAEAAGLVARIVSDCLTTNEGADSWRNTKTNLAGARIAVLKGGGRPFKRYTRRRTHMPNCMGPHSPQTPIDPEQIFHGTKEEEGFQYGESNRIDRRYAV